MKSERTGKGEGGAERRAVSRRVNGRNSTSDRGTFLPERVTFSRHRDRKFVRGVYGRVSVPSASRFSFGPFPTGGGQGKQRTPISIRTVKYSRTVHAHASRASRATDASPIPVPP